MSDFVMTPFFPVPMRFEISMPRSIAMCRAAGDAKASYSIYISTGWTLASSFFSIIVSLTADCFVVGASLLSSTSISMKTSPTW